MLTAYVERILAQTEKPVDIVRRQMEQAGYDPIDGLELFGEEGLSFLLKFVYQSQLLGPAVRTSFQTNLNNVLIHSLGGRTQLQQHFRLHRPGWSKFADDPRHSSSACAFYCIPQALAKSHARSVLRSSSVRFFAPKTRNRGPQPVQDRPRYCGDRTGPPRTGLLRSTQPKKTGSDRFFGVNFVVPIKIIFISAIITLKIKRVIWHSITCKYPSFDQISRDLMNI
jgi:hypothetical protein